MTPTKEVTMRQLLYTSIALHRLDEDCLTAIHRSSQDNNVLYSVTGILWSDGERFIQAIEGPSASVRETYKRIEDDDRHRNLSITRDQLVENRDFHSWSMCHRRSYETNDDYDRKMRQSLYGVPSPIQFLLGAFMGVTADGQPN